MKDSENAKQIENYIADKPISDEKQDRFQRYGFSKRIAETIINRKSSESIVFGLFGAWGEGKSSVLNLIDQELKKDDTIISITFNPWRYSDEDSLLKNFFSQIAKALDKDIDKWYEKIFSFIGKAGSSFKYGGVGVDGIAKILSTVGLETFKKRVNQFLDESKIKLVIFIDDIDRLDKKEIYVLFRLVKLTADFSNTTYILSFDETMVAAAIGEQFGSGDKKAGESFLEKIIQVPLKIPKAQPEALKKFCFKMVDSAIDAAEANLSQEEVQRFVYQFTTNILPRLDTPRLAVRYGNSLSFSMPLLKGQVNMIDLMLIEAVKIFFPEHYAFIKYNPHYFIGSYNGFMQERDQSKVKEVTDALSELSQSFNKAEKLNINNLLSDLFPILNIAYGNQVFSDRDYNQWYIQKKIVSTHYFDRYFAYTVIAGDISDIEFEELVKGFDTKAVGEVAINVREIVEKSDAGNFIRKLRSRENDFEWSQSVLISKAICKVTDLLPNTGGMLGFGFETPTGQAAIFIYQLLKKHKSEDIFSFAKELMLFPDDFVFAYQINYWLRSGNEFEEKLFSYEQYIELAKILVERAIKEAGDESIFEKFPNQILYLIPSWEERDKESLIEYVKSYLNRDKEKVLTLLKAFVPVGRSSARDGEYKTDITEDQYKNIASFFDKDDLYKRILENFSMEEIEKEKPLWIDYGRYEFTELNMVRQYILWYKKEREPKVTL